MATTTLFPLGFGGYDSLGKFYGRTTASMTAPVRRGTSEAEFATFGLTPDQVTGIDNGTLTVTLQFDTTTSDRLPGQIVSIGANAVTDQQASALDGGTAGVAGSGLITNVHPIESYALQKGVSPAGNIGFGTQDIDISANVRNNIRLGPANPNLVITGQLFKGTSAYLNNVELIIACFAAGTLILTGRGETKVELLAEGQTVTTIAGGRLINSPVKWIGHRTIDLTRHPRPEQAAPVRIRAGAFAPGKPHTDLLLSPDHSVPIGGYLVPIRRLVNGATIVQERGLSSVTYYHVELDRHALLLANGLEAESYLDTGNRAIFENAGLALMLYPDMSVSAGLKVWNADSCMPLAVANADVEPLWRQLAARAEVLGWVRPVQATTDDPDLHLRVDGRSIRPIATDGARFRFVLPPGASDVRLGSRVSTPADRPSWLEDIRRLGVAVRRLVVQDAETLREIPVDHPSLAEGWHAPERNDAAIWRWTDGSARVPADLLQAAAILDVHVGIRAQYAAALKQAA